MARGDRSRTARGAALAAGLAVGLLEPAAARTMQQKLQEACADDIRRLCPSEAADTDRLKACLLARRAAASDACMRLVDASE